MKWIAIIRDVVGVWFLSGLGGYVFGFVEADSQTIFLEVVALNIFLSCVGFCISGCWAKSNRWAHLNYVALGIWLIDAGKFIFGPYEFQEWIFTLIPVYIMMGLGGAASFLFVKTPDSRTTSEDISH